MDRAGKTCSLLPQAVSLPRLTWPWYMGASSLYVVWLLFADFQYKPRGLCPPFGDPNIQNVNTAHRKQYLCPRITRWRPPLDPLDRKKSRLPIRVRTATSIGTNSTYAFPKFYLRTQTDSASETLCYSLHFGVLGTLVHISPWSIVLAEKLIVSHLLNKFPKF